MAVRLRVYGPDLTTLRAVLTQVSGLEWSRDRGDVGAASVRVAHDSGELTPDTVVAENLVVVEVDGVDEFAWLVRRRRRTRGDVWDEVVAAGPGVTEVLRRAAVFHRRDCLDASLEDYLVSDERVFGWQTSDFDDGDWDPVPAGGTRLSSNGWPDPLAVAFTAGPRALYRRRLLAVEGAAGPARMALAASVNTQVTVWLDGEEVMSKEPGERGVVTADMLYPECDQIVAVEVVGKAPHAGRWGWTWMRLEEPDDPEDDPEWGQALRRTYDPGEFDGDTPWLVHPGDPHPGVTPGFVLGRLFDEARARGFIEAVTRDFTDLHDSAGEKWTSSVELGVMIGDDSVLDVAERLRAEGVDAAVGPDLVFRAWQRRGVDRGHTPAGGATTVVLDGREVDVETEDELFNVLLARTERHWIERPDPPLAANRREGFLALGRVPSPRGAARLADAELARLNRPRAEFQCVTNSTQDPPRPTVDYDVGDTVVTWNVDLDDLTGPWTLEDLRVDTIAASVDEDGSVDWVHALSRVEL